MRPVDNT